MIRYIAFVSILAIRIGYQPSNAQTVSAFGAVSVAETIGNARILTVAGQIANNKVVINWEVGENETADMFEVEKSSDGKNFSMAALVFGTDEAMKGSYQYYEKASTQKMLYRIKLINKNKQTEYSRIIEVTPNV